MIASISAFFSNIERIKKLRKVALEEFIEEKTTQVFSLGCSLLRYCGQTKSTLFSATLDSNKTNLGKATKIQDDISEKISEFNNASLSQRNYEEIETYLSSCLTHFNEIIVKPMKLHLDTHKVRLNQNKANCFGQDRSLHEAMAKDLALFEKVEKELKTFVVTPETYMRTLD